MKTKHGIWYSMLGIENVLIPAGTPVVPATSLPDGGWWVEEWEGMDWKAQSWQRTYGFHVIDEEVTE